MKGMKLYSFWQVNNRRIRRYLFLWKQFSSSWFQFQSHNWTRMESEMDSESYQQLQQKQLIQFHNPNQKKGKNGTKRIVAETLPLGQKGEEEEKKSLHTSFSGRNVAQQKNKKSWGRKAGKKGNFLRWVGMRWCWKFFLQHLDTRKQVLIE